MKFKIDNYLIEEEIEDIIIDLQRDLLNGKLSEYKVTSSGIRVPCPHHSDGKEAHASCYISNEGVWHCFTCGSSGNIISFISECLDCEIDIAKKWLISHYGKELLIEEQIDIGDFNFKPKLEETKYLDESILDKFQEWHPYMNKRKLTKKVCETFKVKYDPKSESLVFPVWDEYNKLYMLTRRSVNNKRFMIDSTKEKPVYLYNYIKNNNIKEVTITESQINCLTLWGYGIPSVALFGTGTKHQYEILNKSSIKHYYLALDGDEAGRKGIMRFLENIRSDVFVDIIVLPDKKDINDLSEEEFNNLKIIDKDSWIQQNNLSFIKK